MDESTNAAHETPPQGAAAGQPPHPHTPHPDTPHLDDERAVRTLAASFGNLANALDRLSNIAPVNHPQQLVDLLPPGVDDVQRLILSELIKADLQAASNQDLSRDLPFYWPTVESILPRGLVQIELLMECARLRKQTGHQVDWEHYGQAFPAAVDTLHRQAGGTRVLTDIADAEAAYVADLPRLPQLKVGSRYDDFTILRPLGSGSFANVYLARQESMHRLVALKVSERSSDEPQALSQLDHPNIVRVYDQRMLQYPTSNLLYMQYVPGGTLAECIKHLRTVERSQWTGNDFIFCLDQQLLGASQSRPEQSELRERLAHMSWAEVVAWLGMQIAEGLDYAGSRGVLHRDIKPANILLTSEGVPKLADFNVSSTSLTDDARSASNFGGSLAYMSPEQLQVADPNESISPTSLDVRADLFSLGMLLWELWQGERPWKAEPTWTMTEAIAEQRRLRGQPIVAKQPPASPSERILEKVLVALLQSDRDKRPVSGIEVAARLRLAMHPELAHRFEPSPDSLAGRLRRIPVLWLSAAVIFLPNIAASVFNYWYNWWRMSELKPSIPSIERDFTLVADWVNWIVFPLGAILFLIIMVPIARIVRCGKQGSDVSADASADISADELDRLWHIGKMATLICAILWIVSGAVFAGTLAWMHPGQFSLPDAVHFFMSLVLCGGVAGIYPYFGMTLLSVLIYYPQVIAARMVDLTFARRAQNLLRDNAVYLLLAAAIPLTAVSLLVFRESLTRGYVLLGTAITLLGLLAAYQAHRRLERAVEQYARIFK